MWRLRCSKSFSLFSSSHTLWQLMTNNFSLNVWHLWFLPFCAFRGGTMWSCIEIVPKSNWFSMKENESFDLRFDECSCILLVALFSLTAGCGGTDTSSVRNWTEVWWTLELSSYCGIGLQRRWPWTHHTCCPHGLWDQTDMNGNVTDLKSRWRFASLQYEYESQSRYVVVCRDPDLIWEQFSQVSLSGWKSTSSSKPL